MKIISCNCQGAGKLSFRPHCWVLKLHHNPVSWSLWRVGFLTTGLTVLFRGWGLLHIFKFQLKGAGGIWLLWNPQVVSVDIIAYSTQTIDATIQFSQSPEYNGFTSSYVSPIPVKKNVYWDSLKERSIDIKMHWPVAGDLNDIRVASEKFGGAPLNMYRTDFFNNRFDACQLIDLGFSGTPFTWVGTR